MPINEASILLLEKKTNYVEEKLLGLSLKECCIFERDLQENAVFACVCVCVHVHMYVCVFSSFASPGLIVGLKRVFSLIIFLRSIAYHLLYLV